MNARKLVKKLRNLGIHRTFHICDNEVWEFRFNLESFSDFELYVCQADDEITEKDGMYLLPDGRDFLTAGVVLYKEGDE